jgi:hypothetical protein
MSIRQMQVLAQTMGFGTDEAWRENLTAAHSFLLKNVVFDYPAKSQEVLNFRAAISPSVSQRAFSPSSRFSAASAS